MDDTQSHEWAPRRRRRVLPPQQQALADELQKRATALRDGSGGELSVREAVALAAVQLGLELPEEPGG